MIFGGQAGGVPARLSAIWGPLEMVGMEVVSIDFEIANDLAFWRAEVPGKVVARAEALTGPMTPAGQRVQLLNAPGSEVGPGQTATWGRADAQGGCFGAQVGGGRQIQQAHPIRLVRPGAAITKGRIGNETCNIVRGVPAGREGLVRTGSRRAELLTQGE